MTADRHFQEDSAESLRARGNEEPEPRSYAPDEQQDHDGPQDERDRERRSCFRGPTGRSRRRGLLRSRSGHKYDPESSLRAPQSAWRWSRQHEDLWSVAPNRVTDVSRIRGTRRARKDTEGHDGLRNCVQEDTEGT